MDGSSFLRSICSDKNKAKMAPAECSSLNGEDAAVVLGLKTIENRNTSSTDPVESSFLLLF